MVLSKEDIYEQQQKDALCQQYKHRDKFWTDDVGILFRRETKNSSQIVIPKALVPIVLKHCHDSVFAAHQGIGRTTKYIKRKYW